MSDSELRYVTNTSSCMEIIKSGSIVIPFDNINVIGTVVSGDRI